MFGSSKSWGLNSTHLHGTHVPVQEPSTASIADMCGAAAHVCFGPKADIATYSITSSARVSIACGTARPSDLAVLRLITKLYLVGVCTGRSAGFSPLKIRSTYSGARRYWSIVSGP